KSECRNPNAETNSKSQAANKEAAWDFEFQVGICFGFRASDFDRYQYFNRHQSCWVAVLLKYQCPSTHSSLTERQPSGILGNGYTGPINGQALYGYASG